MKDPYFGPVPHKHDDPLARLLSRLAWLMDRAFTVPGTKVQFGLDALIGLVPLGGDVLTGLVQAGLVLIALGRYRVPPALAAQMMANVLLDVGVGAIPLLGDLFDVAFKANTRNMVLLEPYLNRTGSQTPPPTPTGPWMGPVTPIGTSWGCIVVIAVALLAALTLVLIGFVTVVRWILRTS
jgi:Domain of unknown function (DUF4112)